jgi:hypothetical protein
MELVSQHSVSIRASRNRAHSHHQYLRHPFNIIVPSEHIVTPVTIDLRAKRPGREDYHSPPSSAEVMKAGAIPPLPLILLWRITELFKRKNPYRWLTLPS